MRLGSHCSTAGGLCKALERATSIGAQACQIFVKSNMQWLGKPFGPQECGVFATQLAASKLDCVFGHTGYLINLAAPASANRSRSLESLLQELRLAAQLGLPFLVLHPGAHLGGGEAQGLQQVAAGLDEVFAASKDLPVRIALENTAGQGTCLGHQLSHLAAIFDAVQQPKRLGLCFDTAHFFAAGHDIRSPKAWNALMSQTDSLLGLEQILAFHLNDSKSELGSRVDRHEHIGQGKLGLEAFRHIVNDARFASTPGCLETPKSQDLKEDKQNLQRLRSLLEDCGKSRRPSRRSS